MNIITGVRVFKMSVLKNPRKIEKQYLKISIMIMKNQTLCTLDFIIYLQPPVADIDITKETLKYCTMNAVQVHETV